MCTWHFWKCNDCQAEYLHHHINQITQLGQFSLYIRHPRNPPNRKKTQIRIARYFAIQNQIDSDISVRFEFVPRNLGFLIWWVSGVVVKIQIKPKMKFVIDHASDNVRFVLSRLSFFSQKNLRHTTSLSRDLYVCVCVRGCVHNIYGNETSVKMGISTS